MEVSRRLTLLGDEGKTDFAVGSVPRRFRIPRELNSAGGLFACGIGIRRSAGLRIEFCWEVDFATGSRRVNLCRV